MPRGDGTGPLGMGPMTGRGAGYCAGSGAPGFANRSAVCGYGRGGHGFWFRAAGHAGVPFESPFRPAPMDRVDEVELLERRSKMLAAQLDRIRSRIEELGRSNRQ